jgi:AsmA protein
VDRYLPPRTEGRSDGASSARARPAPVAGAAALLPVGLLRSLNLQGQLRVGRLTVSNLQLQDVRLQLDGRGGQLRLHPADAKLYQGRYQGDIRVDARGAEPRVALDESLSGIQLEPLLKSLQGRDWLSGSGGIQAKFTASGNTEQAMRRTLDGNLAFSFHDGAVKGINIAELIRRAKARIDGKALPPSTAPNQTDFAELSGTLQFEGGHARNHDLVLKSPLLRIAGAGEADLVGETVDYELKASIVATLEGQSGKGLEDLKGLTIPVKVQGSLLKPGFSLDLQALLGERAKAKIDQEKGKLEKKLEEKLKQKLPGLSDQLPRLFGP